MKRIVSVSGGKDSTALYLLAVERGKPFDAVFADTGHEAQQTYDFIRDLPRRADGPPIRTVRADFADRLARQRAALPARWRELGIGEDRIERALEALRPTGVPFVDLALSYGMFPRPIQKFCTKELKVQPFQRQVYRPLLRGGHHVVSWQGIRAEESAVRRHMALRQIVSMDAGRIHIVRPLLHWRLPDVMAYIGRRGLSVNPLYGDGFSRVGCFPCIHLGKSEIALLARRYPEAIDRIERWEALVSEVSRAGRAATFFGGARDPTWDPSQPTSIRRTVEWARTKRGGRQIALVETISRAQEHMGEACAESGLCE